MEDPSENKKTTLRHLLMIFVAAIIAIVLVILGFSNFISTAQAQESSIGEAFGKFKNKVIELTPEVKKGVNQFVESTESDFATRGRVAKLYGSLLRDDAGVCYNQQPKLYELMKVPKLIGRFREGRKMDENSTLGTFYTGLYARKEQPTARTSITRLNSTLGLNGTAMPITMLKATLEQLRQGTLCELPTATQSALKEASQILVNGTDAEQNAAGEVFITFSQLQ